MSIEIETPAAEEPIASTAPVAEDQSAVEEGPRIGSESAPASPDDYALNIPAHLAHLEETLEPEQVLAFQAEIHDLGLNQHQYDVLMTRYLEQVEALTAGGRTHELEAAKAELGQIWKTPEEMRTKVALADSVIRSYAGDDAAGIFKDYGNDPRIARMMARIGSDLSVREATTSAPSGRQSMSIDDLRRSEAYHNAKHPDHDRVSAQVAAHNERTYGRGRAL